MSGLVASGTTLSTATRANREFIAALIRKLPTETDLLAQRYAVKIRTRARRYAPSSSRTRAMGRDSNNPREQTLAKSIMVKGSNGRYRIITEAPHARFVISGTRPHIIMARQYGVRESQGAVKRQIASLNRRVDRALYLQARFETRRVARPHRSKGEVVRRQHQAARNEARIGRYLGATEEFEDGLRDEEHALARQSDRGGKRRLSFAWSKGRMIPGLGLGFRGPAVFHPGVRANPFLQRAVSDYTLPFFQDLRRLFEGRGLR